MKYFVVSDVHSYYTLMINALKDNGFELDNPNHTLILCGDAFDRGEESEIMYNFLKYMNSKNRLVYIRGNHEDLLLDFYKRGYFKSYDTSNNTDKTIMHLTHMSKDYLKIAPQDAVQRLKDCGIIDFIEQNSVDYFETNKFIFCHGYIPEEQWRKADKNKWTMARWDNGMYKFMTEERKLSKTIIVGHWHCNWYRDFALSYDLKWRDFSIQELENDNKDKLIAIDACTAYSGKVNVLVIEGGNYDYKW